MTAGAHAVYQCAQPEYHEWAEKFPRLQQAILDGAAANGARLVVADNLYMYGDPKGQPIHEALPMRPNTRKGAVRAQMAQAVMDAHAAGRLRVAVVRGSDFFGPEDGATSAHNFPAALAGKPIDLMGRIDMPHTFTYTPDFGRALAWAGMNARALGEVWHVPSAPAITQRQFADALALALGRPVKTRVSGRLMLSLIGLFNPTLREMPEMLYEWDAPYILDDTKMRAASGLQHTPLGQRLQGRVFLSTHDAFAHAAAPAATP